jgi:3-oxoacyl-[acyl-carrier protein] reductase
MDLRLRDKVILVTAASRGLGAAAARRFAEEGARVAVTARNAARLDETAIGIAKDTGAEVLAIVGDVANAAEAERMVRDTIERWGRLDGLVINAGGPPGGKFLELKIEQWEAAIQLTLMSAVRLCYAAVPHMLKNDPPERGSIVAITSMTVKQPIDGLLLSNSLRLAVIGLLRTLANELGPQGIRINAVGPGWTLTERVMEIMQGRAKANGTTVENEIKKVTNTIPFGRMGDPAELADAVVWLASPRASYVHGQTLLIDGGWMRPAM